MTYDRPGYDAGPRTSVLREDLLSTKRIDPPYGHDLPINLCVIFAIEIPRAIVGGGQRDGAASHRPDSGAYVGRLVR